MYKQEEIYVTVQYQNLSRDHIRRHLQDWLVLVRLLYRADKMIYNDDMETAFDLAECHRLIDGIKAQDELSLTLTDGRNESSFHLVEGNMLEKHLLSSQIFLDNRKMITTYVEVQMKSRGVFGYIRSYDEFIYHNEEDIAARRLFQDEAEIQQLPKLKREEQVLVDCNQFAGYDIFYKGFCLTSCWRMYFGHKYHQIIPLAVIKDVQQVEQVQQLSDQVLMVELYKDPFRWDEPINLDYQRLFRDQMGIDQLAWNNGVGILREPFIEYAYSDNMIQTVSYQNERLQPTNKKAATHFVTRTYDLLRGQCQEKRVKGVLNAQAFFPWVDEQGLKMMNYIVINPSFSLDDGLQAYQFYLRNYLEVDLKDARYRDYVAVLNVYVPDEYVESIPFDQLRETMSDIEFSKLKRRKTKSYFDLTKGSNHLRVNFVPYTALKQIDSSIVGG